MAAMNFGDLHNQVRLVGLLSHFLYWNLLGHLQEMVRGMYMHCCMTLHEFS